MAASVRVLGEMLLRQEYNQTKVCVWGHIEDLAKSGREFTLKTTDGKKVQVSLQEPVGEYLDGLVEVRGSFDGRRLAAEHYQPFLREMSDDFDCETYNEAVRILRSARV